MRDRPAHLLRRRTAGPLACAVHILRPQAGSRNEWGEWVQGGYERIAKFEAVSTPMRGRIRDEGISGVRLVARRQLISDSEIRAARLDAGGDLILSGDDYWRCAEVERWAATAKRKQASGVHPVADGLMYKATIERLEDQDRTEASGLFGAYSGADPGIPTPRVMGSDLLERAIRRYISIGSGLPRTHVIPANSPGPAPAGVYASLLIRSQEQLGHPYGAEYPRRTFGFDDAGDSMNQPFDSDESQRLDVVRQIRIVRRSECSIQFYRQGATERAKQLADWTATETAKLAEAESAFTVRTGFNIRSIDAKAGPDIEERASLDMAIDHIDTTSEILRSVTEIPLTIEGLAGEQRLRVQS